MLPLNPLPIGKSVPDIVCVQGGGVCVCARVCARTLIQLLESCFMSAARDTYTCAHRCRHVPASSLLPGQKRRTRQVSLEMQSCFVEVSTFSSIPGSHVVSPGKVPAEVQVEAPSRVLVSALFFHVPDAQPLRTQHTGVLRVHILRAVSSDDQPKVLNFAYEKSAG